MSNSPVPVSVTALIRCPSHSCSSLAYFAPVREAMSQDAVAAASEAAGFGWLPAVPIQITAGVDIGYDDHVTGNTQRAQAVKGSFFARENVVLTYDRPTERTQVSLIGVGRFDQFFDVWDGRDRRKRHFVAHA